MTAPNVLNQKWLSDVELLDFEIEQSDSLMPENVAKFFTSITSNQMKVTLTDGILNDISKELQETIPWFLSQMPPLYLWSTSQKAIMDDILEIISGKVLSEKQMAERHSAVTQTVTLIASGEHSSSTTRIAYVLSRYPAKIIRIFTSLDKKMGLCEVYQAPYSSEGMLDNTHTAEKLNAFRKALSNKPKKDVESLISILDKDYVKIASVKQMLLAAEAVTYCTENENSYVNLTTIFDEQSNQHRARIDIGLKNFPVNAAVEYIIGIFNRYNFQVRRILANEICINSQEKYTVIHLITATPTGEMITDKMKAWGKTVKSLKALSYVDHGDECSNLLQGDSPFSINESNLVRAVANWVHIFLTKQNPYYYSFDRVSKIILNHRIST